MYIRGLKFIFISIFNHQYTKYKFRLDAKHECLTGIPYMNAGHLWILHKIHTNSDKAFHLLNVFIKLVTYIKQKLETGSYLSCPYFHMQNMETHCAYRYTYIAYTYMYTYIYIHTYTYTQKPQTLENHLHFPLNELLPLILQTCSEHPFFQKWSLLKHMWQVLK